MAPVREVFSYASVGTRGADKQPVAAAAIMSKKRSATKGGASVVNELRAVCFTDFGILTYKLLSVCN
jgi:hypothetical protein